MKRFLLALALSTIFLAGLRADFQAGLDAYNRGDFAAALREWQPLAEKGDANAQYNLGMMYARGQGTPEDFHKAVEWYLKAAEQGVAAAQYNLGVIYANGQGGVPQNVTEARKWFEKAASKGVAEAENGLGFFYGTGQGIAKDYAEAAKWYRKAADSGVASAQYNLGLMYDLGQGGQRNFPEAMKWYRKAAEQGYAAAQCNLGILYYNAQGAERDLAQAYAWFSLCEKSGDPRAAQLRRTVESRIKSEDLAKGKQLAAAFHTAAPPNRTGTDRLFVKAEPKTHPAGETAAASADRQAPAAANAAPAPSPTESAGLTAPAPSPISHLPSPAVQSYWAGVDRVVAVGDVFGDFEQFFTVLESAGLVDGNGNWVGGAAHLVQTGNIVHHGPDARKIMDLLMRLEPQAAAAGGSVHCLIGNHEAMDLYGDARFVSPAEFDSYRTLDPNAAASAAPGQSERRAAFNATGVYGRWISGHNAVMKIDNSLFVHAGIGPRYIGWSIDRINQEVRGELASTGGLHGGIVTDPEGPLLYTSLAKGSETEMAPLVDRILSTYGVERIIIGHSYAGAAVTPRFGGKVILINIGLSRVVDPNGRLACLVIAGGHPCALHRGQKLELPRDDGPDLLRYLRQAAALDPRPSPLEPRIAALIKTVPQH